MTDREDRTWMTSCEDVRVRNYLMTELTVAKFRWLIIEFLFLYFLILRPAGWPLSLFIVILALVSAYNVGTYLYIKRAGNFTIKLTMLSLSCDMVAVAAGLVPGATGTDTGGSIRQPASLTGITGLKPTYGLVSRYGMIAFASSLDQAGPMAPSAEDCALLLNVMTGFDPKDSTSLEREKEDYTRDLHQPLAGLRVGLPKEFFAEGLNNEVAIAVDAAVAELKKLGATTVEISLANSKLAIPVYYVLAPAEASSNLSRFDGVRYGYRAPDYADLNDMYAKTRAQGFGAEVKRRILIGAYVLSHGYYDAYYLQAQKIRRLIADDFNEAFKACDVILGPTAPGTAFKLGEKSDDPVEMYLNDLYTIPANLAGLPGMSLPCGFDSHGLPIGLQLVGNYFSEAKMLNVAHQYQRVTDWHARQPEGLQ